MKIPFVLLWLIFCGALLHAQDDTGFTETPITSPDGAYSASCRNVPDHVYIWRKDVDHFCLVIVKHNNVNHIETYVRYEPLAERSIAKMAWSPDSNFLVMTTVSSGGHSPWHFSAYVYSIADKSLRYMDDVIGSVVRADFEFSDDHTASMKISKDGDFDHPKTIEVDLRSQVAKMKTLEGKQEGKTGG